MLEVVAYALDEAAEGTTTQIDVMLRGDGAVLVADDGRGTDTRLDEAGKWMIKPIMATRDLRFFDAPDSPLLSDGLPRSGMSVVAALSEWLEHTNVRAEGAWTARYERGLPVGTPRSQRSTDQPGTTVCFLPDREVFGGVGVDAARLSFLLADITSSATVRLSSP